MHELLWITNFFVTSEAICCQIVSWVTKNSLFMVTNVLFYFLYIISRHEHINPLKTTIECSFRHCCQGRSFLTCMVTSPQLICDVRQTRDTGICDVIFVDCHRENSPITQTSPKPTLLSWGGGPREKFPPHPWPHGKPGLIALIGPLRPYCSQSPLILLRCVTEIKFAQNLRWLRNWH